MKCSTIFLAATLVAVVMSCETPCTNEIQPICGFDGVNLRLFSNKCLMSNQKCRDGSSWQPTDLSECSTNIKIHQDDPIAAYVAGNTPKCAEQCPAVQMQVCGFDGYSYKLFENQCEMDRKNCAGGGKDGKLYESAWLKRCICPGGSPPVVMVTCGYDGDSYKVFDNAYSMEIFNCFREDGKVFKLAPIELCCPRTASESAPSNNNNIVELIVSSIPAGLKQKAFDWCMYAKYD